MTDHPPNVPKNEVGPIILPTGLPNRLSGWVDKARAKGRETIELDCDTVDQIIAAVIIINQAKENNHG